MNKLFLSLAMMAVSVNLFADQSISIYNDDSLKTAPSSWWTLDPEHDQVPGISTEKAYQFLQGRPSTTVVVAVIDSGIDIEHEDLQEAIWTNADEIAGNGIDDDQNGYIDDIHGWNFLGGTDGNNIEFDSNELTREYARLQEKYSMMTEQQRQTDEEWEYFQKIEREYNSAVKKMEGQLAGFKEFYDQFKKAERLIKAYTDQDELSREDLITWESPDDKISLARAIMLTVFDNGFDSDLLDKQYEYYTTALNYGYNIDYNPREIIGDDIDDPYEKIYGNNDVIGDFAFHGTHVAGIIAARRNNGIGINGIADNVKIMVIRAVPNGDERDKDVANAIIYAVNNGAQIINMSFGKRFSPDKEAVDKAVKYAESKGVLLVHAAGNDAHNIDEIIHYPSRKMLKTGQPVNNWLEVGAVSWKADNELIASFSNYGKENVDIFAPGVDILSTAPNQDYQKASGTSMAAPVTTGVAALIMSYFPGLSAEEVRQVIINSTINYSKQKVIIPGMEEEGKFGELSQTGGVVNAYEAVKLAQKSRPNSKKLLSE